jgi:hypothetical protein
MTKPEGLKAFTENAKLKEAGLKANIPQKMFRMIIKGHPGERDPNLYQEAKPR